MLFEFYLAQIERQFFEYRLKNKNFNSVPTTFVHVAAASLDLGPCAEIRDYVVSFEKFFLETFLWMLRRKVTRRLFISI